MNDDNFKLHHNESGDVDDGVDYRTIANTMTKRGFKMNHSSVRNYILRIMKKFVAAYAQRNEIELTDEKMNSIAKSSMFHNGISDALHDMSCMKGKNVKR